LELFPVSRPDPDPDPCDDVVLSLSVGFFLYGPRFFFSFVPEPDRFGMCQDPKPEEKGKLRTDTGAGADTETDTDPVSPPADAGDDPATGITVEDEMEPN